MVKFTVKGEYGLCNITRNERQFIRFQIIKEEKDIYPKEATNNWLDIDLWFNREAELSLDELNQLEYLILKYKKILEMEQGESSCKNEKVCDEKNSKDIDIE